MFKGSRFQIIISRADDRSLQPGSVFRRSLETLEFFSSDLVKLDADELKDPKEKQKRNHTEKLFNF